MHPGSLASPVSSASLQFSKRYVHHGAITCPTLFDFSQSVEDSVLALREAPFERNLLVCLQKPGRSIAVSSFQGFQRHKFQIDQSNAATVVSTSAFAYWYDYRC